MKKLLTIIVLSAFLPVPAIAAPNHERPEFAKLGPKPQTPAPQPEKSAPVTPGAPTTGK